MKKLKYIPTLFGRLLVQSTFDETCLDMIELPCGALLASEDAADVICRISYR